MVGEAEVGEEDDEEKERLWFYENNISVHNYYAFSD